MTQKLGGIIDALTATIPPTTVEKVTMIDSKSGNSNMAGKAISTLEQIKQIFGIDIVEKANNMGAVKKDAELPARQEVVTSVVSPPAPQPVQEVVQNPGPPKLKKSKFQFEPPKDE